MNPERRTFRRRIRRPGTRRRRLARKFFEEKSCDARFVFQPLTIVFLSLLAAQARKRKRKLFLIAFSVGFPPRPASGFPLCFSPRKARGGCRSGIRARESRTECSTTGGVRFGMRDVFLLRPVDVARRRRWRALFSSRPRPSKTHAPLSPSRFPSLSALSSFFSFLAHATAPQQKKTKPKKQKSASASPPLACSSPSSASPSSSTEGCSRWATSSF